MSDIGNPATCAECGTIAGGDPPPRPRWVCTVPVLAVLLVLGVISVVSLLRLDRLSYGSSLSDPFMQFVEPPIEERILRAAAAGAERVPPDLIDRLLSASPAWIVDAPHSEELHVQFLPPRSITYWRVEIGRPWAWLILEEWESLENAFDPSAKFSAGLLLRELMAGGAGGTWNSSDLSVWYHSAIGVRMGLHAAAIASVILLVVITGLVAGVAHRQLARRLLRGRPLTRRRRPALIAALLVSSVLIVWTALDIEDSGAPVPQSLPGETSSPIGSLTREALRELRADPGGDATVARMIVEAIPAWPGGSHEDASPRLLCADFYSPAQWRNKGWRVGWPTWLVAFYVVQCDLPVDGRLQAATWSPRPTSWRLYGSVLIITLGSDASDRLRTLYIDLAGFGALLLLLLMAWWVSRVCALVTLRRVRRRRVRTGRCLACGYPLDVLTLV